MDPRQCLRHGSLSLALLATAGSATAIDSATLISSSLSTDCLAYRVVGVCYWLRCTPYGCKVKTSVKVRHYVPDAVVSSYADTGKNPWREVALMSPANPSAQGGGDSTTNQSNENALLKFKNADVIGHPGTLLFNRFASQFGYSCTGASTAYRPYFLSSFDVPAWRYNVPEMIYPEALTPGQREVGVTGDMWGNVYPRGGFLQQADDYKAAAVVAQRAGDVVTRSGQPHLYQSLLARAQPGYWPAGALRENDADSGKWQRLQPDISMNCAVFPNSEALPQAEDGAYAWGLWRPYSCCKREGQFFLGSTDTGS
ncbi:TIGR03756 family integrating conjugative element protein [Pseudomonas sp. S3E17]|uniref:TIGR03756 family integrating conjugative element protein n=1 Tax=Pseudomonas sp. S3E17 TaxID=2817893 RepID=UPI00209E960C|nr:TIGR03756 family integrating conjugative element protein [Pseudomonas sp. S3E17]MCP1463326.1 integrating conjugative element protein (TIGR03756 family) [Pseudomonas sp. S3E17]